MNNININRDFTKKRLIDKLLPWQVTGLTDGEGAFICSILNTGKGITNYSVKLEFKVTQKKHSEGILLELKEYFGCGNVVIDNRSTDTMKYQVKSIDDILEKIIPHFIEYPCLTSKYLNFRDWKEIAKLMVTKEHLRNEGLEKIKKISSLMNTKRTFEDKYNHCKSFLGFSLLTDGNYHINYNLPANWVQAFLDGESSFYTYVSDKNTKIIVDSSLEIGQNSHDIFILLALKKFFNGGYIKPKFNYGDLLECSNSRSVNRFVLRNTDIIINFVKHYPLLTRKHLDYLDWKQIVELKKNKQHLNAEGLNLIKQIRSGLNSNRDSNKTE